MPRFLKHSRPHGHGRHHHHQDRQIMLKHRVKYPQYPPLFRSPFDMSTMRLNLPVTRGARESSAAMKKRVTQEMLRLHNYHRARHCAKPLVINNRLNQTAQSYAEHLAATSTFEHSHMKFDGENLGENLYMSWISFGPVKVDPKAAVKSWYDEIALHDFDNPKFSTQTGHFTQMVWRGSKQLGVGVALSDDGQSVYMVTHYFPAGNITNAGYFKENVLPPTC